MGHQDIKCGVQSCKFNTDAHCSLNSITVGCEPPECNPRSESETICSSFRCK
ncbi:MAG: DUF1540 domain-containing protein [Defluviitaleaceae bacterium]|nr:DUF1540 domain-containing protein [Defluviitaleaceae bacterium]